MFMHIKRIALSLAVAISTLSGCVNTDPGHVELTEEQISDLAARSIAPQDIGLRVEEDGEQPAFSNTGKPDSNAYATVPIESGSDQRILHSIIDCEVNGRSVRALVDTGSPFTFVPLEIARKTELRPIRNEHELESGCPLHITPLRGLGGESSQISALAKTITLGEVRLNNIPVGIINSQNGLGSLEWIGHYKVEMVIGNDLLSKFTMATFDFLRNRIEFGRNPNLADEDLSLQHSTALFRCNPVPVAIGNLPENSLIPMVIDTGSDSGLWLPANLAQNMRLRDIMTNQEIGSGRGFGGDTVIKKIAPRAITFDNITIRNVPIVVEVTPQIGRDLKFGLLGQKVLQRFKVSIDYENERLYLQRR